jgi:hypothetical protein
MCEELGKPTQRYVEREFSNAILSMLSGKKLVARCFQDSAMMSLSKH